jgi:hypothetical protein
MSHLQAIVEAAGRRSESLFGSRVPPSELRASLLATGTRTIYRVQEARHPSRPIIVKRRPFKSPDDGRAAATQTRHEFELLTAVWSSMVAAGVRDYAVPRPLAADPEHGLLFMEQVAGLPVERLLRHQLLRFRCSRTMVETVRRCGEWLHTFSEVAPPIQLPTVTGADVAIVRGARPRHHVYRLLGLRGESLVDAVISHARQRLATYGVEPSLIRRIEWAFSRTLREFDASADRQVNVHGKYSVADVLTEGVGVSVVDLEQADRGCAYLDAAYFLFQIDMVIRWRPFFDSARALRSSFLAGRAPAHEFDDRVLDSFIAYYLVNSFRPGDGLRGMTARSYAHSWIQAWLRRAGA